MHLLSPNEQNNMNEPVTLPADRPPPPTRRPKAKKPPVLLNIRSSNTVIIGTVVMAIFTDIFLYGLVVPVIPFALEMRVGTPRDEVQKWTAVLLGCYSATLCAGAPLVGWATDRWSSRRGPLLAGLVSLAGATLILMLGRSIGLLMVGRLLQGLSAAVVWTVGMALLADTMGSSIAMAMSYVNIGMCSGLLFSPLLGGAIYASAGYYAVYYLAYAIIFVDIVMRFFMIEKKVARQWLVPQEENAKSAPDLMPNVTDTDTDATIAQFPNPMLAPVDKSAATTAPVLRKVAPMGAFRSMLLLLRSKRMAATLYGVVVQAAILMAFDAVLPLFVKRTFHWNSAAAGCVFIALFLPCVLSPCVGWSMKRFGSVWPSLLGFLTSAPLLVCLRFVSENTTAHKVLLCALLAMLGTTLEFAYIPLMAEISFIVEDKEAKRPGVFGDKGVYGMAYALYTTFWALGGTAGSVAAGYLVESPGWGTAMLLFGVVSLTGTVVVSLGVGGGGRDLFKKPKPREARTSSQKSALDEEQGVGN